MTRPLLVGEDNPYGNEPRYALYPYPPNASGGRLMRLLGLTVHGYLRRFERVNLCVGPWSLQSATARAEALLAERPSQPFVLLGAKVSQAFGYDFWPFTRTGGIYILPHPSGRSRAWNDPEAVGKARVLLAEFLR